MLAQSVQQRVAMFSQKRTLCFLVWIKSISQPMTVKIPIPNYNRRKARKIMRMESFLQFLSNIIKYCLAFFFPFYWDKFTTHNTFHTQQMCNYAGSYRAICNYPEKKEYPKNIAVSGKLYNKTNSVRCFRLTTNNPVYNRVGNTNLTHLQHKCNAYLRIYYIRLLKYISVRN